MKKQFFVPVFAAFAIGWCPPAQGQDIVPRSTLNLVGVLVEWVEVDARTANKLVRKHLAKAGDAPNTLRDEVEKLIDTGDAKLMDMNYIMTGPGNRATVKSVDEIIYPTEFEPPQVPRIVGLLGAKMVPSAATPTAFDVRYAGPTVEVEPNIDRAGKVISINIQPEWVTYEGKEPVTRDGTPNAEMSDAWTPKINTLKVATNFKLRDGETKLITVVGPKAEGKRILVFVQANVLR